MMRVLKYLLPGFESEDPRLSDLNPKPLSFSIDSVNADHRKPRISSVIEIGDFAYTVQSRPEACSPYRRSIIIMRTDLAAFSIHCASVILQNLTF